jgi:flavoprotein
MDRGDNESLLPLMNVEIGNGSIDLGKKYEDESSCSNCWKCCGLTSNDKKVQRRAQFKLSACIVCNIVFVTLLIFVSELLSRFL